MPRGEDIALAGALAAPTCRCLAREQLLAAGLTPKRIRGLLKSSYLVRVFRGVYIVGVPTVSHDEFLQACLLHAGPAAVLDGRSGLERRRLLPVCRGLASVTTRRHHVSSPARTLLRLDHGSFGDLYVHRSTPSLPLPVEVVDGFETTLLPRTLVDAAAHLDGQDLRRAWREADYRGLLDPAAIREQLDEHRREGAPKIRERLEAAYPLTTPGTQLHSRSGELLFLELLREAGLPTPEANVPMMIGGRQYVADFFDRELGLVFEIDGPQHHGSEHGEADRVRDVEFFVAGLDVVRITTARMERERAWTIDRIQAVYERQARRMGLHAPTAPPAAR